MTSPRGFLAGAVAAGLRAHGSGDDLALLYSESPCATAGLFTDSAFKAAAVLLSQQHLADGRAQAVIANSGCANAYTGDDGYRDSDEMARLAASRLRLADSDVLVASTGVTGRKLPMDKIRAALPSLAVRADGGERFARAIMTTDTVAKQTGVAFHVDDREYRVGGCAKGAGMIHPNLATMLAFVTSDAAVEADLLRRTLRQAADLSFDMISVDGDTSPNDTLLLLANGAAGGPTLREGDQGARLFAEAVETVCIELAKALARDAEGATKLIEVEVEGAASVADARTAARTVVGSPLVKSAVYGNDPNWGRVLAAIARSGARAEERTVSLFWQGVCVFRQGRPLPFDERALSSATREAEVHIRADLGQGEAKAVAWGCDLTEEYVKINSEYTT
ncbi:MAG: bifunctional glutamate N-acetyltransferase/amino-acid acetyltransferase ArgJ [Dehalococcoidia bacterium]